MRITYITFLMALYFSAAISDIPQRVPRNCFDIQINGNQVEGHYVLFPENPNEPILAYCSVADGMTKLNSSAPKISAKNCQNLYDSGMHDSGLNAIYPYANHPETPIIVFCDQELLGGGWTVIQRRDDYDTQLDFYRTFDDYALGFGNPGGECWIGNDIIHELTYQSVNELYVDLTNVDDINKYAHYKSFSVGPRESPNDDMSTKPYQLSVSLFEGSAGDSMSYHLGWGFTTFDADNDDNSGNCAVGNGGWWYKTCYRSNLNGVYDSNIYWFSFNEDGDQDSELMKRVFMAVRPLKQQ